MISPIHPLNTTLAKDLKLRYNPASPGGLGGMKGMGGMGGMKGMDGMKGMGLFFPLSPASKPQANV